MGEFRILFFYRKRVAKEKKSLYNGTPAINLWIYRYGISSIVEK